MMPGIFNHMPMEQDSDDDEGGFGLNRKKKNTKKQITDLVDGMSQSLHDKAGGDSNSDDDDADLFSVPLNSDAFMAKIAQQ